MPAWVWTDDATLTQASLEALDSFGAMLLNSKISALHRRCILGIAWDTARCGDALLGTDDLAALSTEETALCEVGAICIAAAIELQLAKGSAIGSAKSAVVPNVRPWEWLQWRVEACARAAHIAGLDSNKSEALRNIAASLLEPYRLGFEELHQQELAALEVAQLRKELQAQEHQERQQKLKRIKEIQEQRSGGDPELQAALDLELKVAMATGEEGLDRNIQLLIPALWAVANASCLSFDKNARGASRPSGIGFVTLGRGDGEEKETEDKNGKKEAKSGGKKAGVDKDKLAKTEAEEKTLWVEPSGKSDSKDAVWLGPLSAREVLKMAEDQSLGPDGLVWGLHDRGEDEAEQQGRAALVAVPAGAGQPAPPGLGGAAPAAFGEAIPGDAQTGAMPQTSWGERGDLRMASATGRFGLLYCNLHEKGGG
ncbi:unnamed protein product [Effrenium voratum]|nr:unnamed protein product [Effrenium voratum]